MIIDYDIYLEHYGVKGMQWGVRKERRAAAKRAKRAGKAKKYLDEAKMLDTKISSLSSTKSTNSSRRKIAKLAAKRNQALDDAVAKSQGKLTDKQRKIALGAAAVGAIIAGGAVYTSVQSGQARRLMEKGKDYLKTRENKYDPGWKLDRSLSDKMSSEEIMSKVVSKINPNYGDTGTKVNCRRATLAYEMRRRGYDVKATKTTNGHGQTFLGMRNVLDGKSEDQADGRFRGIPNMLKEAKKQGGSQNVNMWGEEKLITDKESIFQGLSYMPNGARGELGMGWRSGGGHSMAFEIIRGKPVIFDTQSGRRYTESSSEFQRIVDNMAAVSYTRLDNKTLDTNYLMKWVRNDD